MASGCFRPSPDIPLTASRTSDALQTRGLVRLEPRSGLNWLVGIRWSRQQRLICEMRRNYTGCSARC